VVTGAALDTFLDIHTMRIIRGRKAVVTGAASGIGRAIAIALAAEGADLFLIDRDADGLTSITRETAGCGVNINTAVCDLTVPAEITQTIAQVRATWDTVNILVNCAGVASYGLFHLTAEETWRQTMAVNLLAPMQVVHDLLPTLLVAEEAHILNLCSFVGLVPVRKLPTYQASKFGLVGFTLALRIDYHRENFGVTALCPGFVRTPLLTSAKDPEAHRLTPAPPALLSTTPECVAAKAIAAIRHNRGLVVITPFAKLSWWMMRLSPSLVGWFNREGWRRRGHVLPPRQKSRDTSRVDR
jgi:short-subunit dehydrogenase